MTHRTTYFLGRAPIVVAMALIGPVAHLSMLDTILVAFSVVAGIDLILWADRTRRKPT